MQNDRGIAGGTPAGICRRTHPDAAPRPNSDAVSRYALSHASNCQLFMRQGLGECKRTTMHDTRERVLRRNLC